MKQTIINTCLGLALCGALLAGPAEDIVKKHTKAIVAELEAYLEKNPDAEDKARAHKTLLMSYKIIGDTEKSTSIYREQFDAAGSGADVQIGMLYNATNNLFNFYLQQGKTDDANKLIEDAIKKSVASPQEEKLTNAFKLMQGQLNKPKIGDAMDMKFTSLGGKEIDLAEMKGKAVLIDFWATWCGPCIKEIPHLKKAYEKYHEKGFEIISVSVDKESDKEKLEAMIKAQNMTWPQHFDGKGSANVFAIKYGVNRYPTTFLVGKEGKVIATDLRGVQLEQALAKELSTTSAE